MQFKSTFGAVLRHYPMSDLMSRHAEVCNAKSQDSNSMFGIFMRRLPAGSREPVPLAGLAACNSMRSVRPLPRPLWRATLHRRPRHH